MRRTLHVLAIAITVLIVAPLLFGVGSAIGLGAERAANYVANVRDARTSVDVDAPADFPYVYRVVQSAPTVDDSTIACAIYRTGKLEVGLMTPAVVARRTTPDSVSIDYDENVERRCTKLVESRGFKVTQTDVPRVLRWSASPGTQLLPRSYVLRT